MCRSNSEAIQKFVLETPSFAGGTCGRGADTHDRNHVEQMEHPIRNPRSSGGGNGVAVSLERHALGRARDPVQPRSGSLSDLSAQRHECSTSTEEDDFFSSQGIDRSLGPLRPRAHTCPENRVWKRRKLKVLNRPPTPPPSPGNCIKPLTLEAHSSASWSSFGGTADRLSKRASLSSSRELASFEEEETT